MGKVDKIEDRTNWFIAEYKRLSEEGAMPSNIELARILNIKSKSTISNILAGTQNIQPEAWRIFKEHFGIEKSKSSDNIESAPQNEPSAMQILAVLAEAFKAQAELMKNIEKNMARQETQANVEANVKLVLETLRTVAARQEADEEIVLHSLERIEGLPKKKLFQDAGKRKSQIEELAEKFGSGTA